MLKEEGKEGMLKEKEEEGRSICWRRRRTTRRKGGP